MRFKEYYLKEKFHDGFKFGNHYIEVFIYPTTGELKSILKNSLSMMDPSIRFGLTDEKRPKIYAWDGGLLHNEMIRKVKFHFGCHWDGVELVGDGSESKWRDFSDLKYKYEVLKTIKKFIPKAKDMYLRGEGNIDMMDLDVWK